MYIANETSLENYHEHVSIKCLIMAILSNHDKCVVITDSQTELYQYLVMNKKETPIV